MGAFPAVAVADEWLNCVSIFGFCVEDLSSSPDDDNAHAAPIRWSVFEDSRVDRVHGMNGSNRFHQRQSFVRKVGCQQATSPLDKIDQIIRACLFANATAA